MENNELVDLTFEEALKRLEEVVDILEAGEVPLEKAITLFQEGMNLSQVCSSKLDKVEQQIETLLEENGSLIVKPIDLEGDYK